MLRLQLTLTSKESRRTMRDLGRQPGHSLLLLLLGRKKLIASVAGALGPTLWTCRDERMSSVGKQVQGCFSVRVSRWEALYPNFSVGRFAQQVLSKDSAHLGWCTRLRGRRPRTVSTSMIEQCD
eukprot:15479931-Heterocapsa_arctica.AAC.1